MVIAAGLLPVHHGLPAALADLADRLPAQRDAPGAVKKIMP